MQKKISNAKLKLADIPTRLIRWDESAQTFALTFDGYEHFGSLEACARIANRKAPRSLTDYRTCLFFEQRRWRHMDSEPGKRDLVYLRSLLAGIRRMVKQGKVD